MGGASASVRREAAPAPGFSSRARLVVTVATGTGTCRVLRADVPPMGEKRPPDATGVAEIVVHAGRG